MRLVNTSRLHQKYYHHVFSPQRCMVGLNFCDESEAQRFNDAVQQIVIRNKKRKGTSYQSHYTCVFFSNHQVTTRCYQVLLSACSI